MFQRIQNGLIVCFRIHILQRHAVQNSVNVLIYCKEQEEFSCYGFAFPMEKNQNRKSSRSHIRIESVKMILSFKKQRPCIDLLCPQHFEYCPLAKARRFDGQLTSWIEMNVVKAKTCHLLV